MPTTLLRAPSDFQTFLRPYEIRMRLLKQFHPIVKQKSIFFQQLQTMQFVAVIAVLTSTVLQKFEFPLSLFFPSLPTQLGHETYSVEAIYKLLRMALQVILIWIRCLARKVENQNFFKNKDLNLKNSNSLKLDKTNLSWLKLPLQSMKLKGYDTLW